jgi:hypothetical protein
MGHTVGIGLVVLACCARASAQPASFEWLAEGQARWSSDAGGVLVGTFDYWPLYYGGQPRYLEGIPRSVSRDGRVLVGNSLSGRATLWTDQVPTALPDVPGFPGLVPRAGSGSPDGVWVAGAISVSQTDPRAWIWSQTSGMIALPMPPGASGAGAERTSNLGAVTIGSAVVNSTTRPVRWAGTMPSILTEGTPTSLGADGQVMVGYAAGDGRGLRWCGDTALPMGDIWLVRSVSADGWVAGGQGSPLTVPMIWDPVHGARGLIPVLQALGANPPTEYYQFNVFAISPDGTAIVGSVALEEFSPPQAFLARIPSFCYANCDGSTSAPVLNVLDFGCFLNRFTAGTAGNAADAIYANCDNSSAAPMLNVLDFNCFLNKFTAGCP